MSANDAELTKEEQESAQVEDKLISMGIIGIKKYFLACLFFLIVASTLFIIYLSTAAIIFAFVPTLIISIVSLLPCVFSVNIASSYGMNLFFSFGIVIVYFPVFTIFIWIMWTAFFSFFKNMWKNINPTYLFRRIVDNIEQGSSYCQVAFQYFLFTLLFVLIIFFFFEEDLGIITIIYGFTPVLKGFWDLIVHAWKSMFSKEYDSADYANALAAEYEETYKLADCCLCRCCCKRCIKGDNPVSIPKSLLDPAELRFMTEFHAFIEDPFCNPFLHFDWNLKMIPGIIVFLYSIVLFIISIARLINDPTYHSTALIAFPIVTVLFLPFLIIFNITSLFLPKGKFITKGNLRTMMLIVGVLYAIGILLILAALIAKAAFTPVKDPVIKYMEPSNETAGYYTINPPPFCSANIYGHDVIQAASMLLLPRQYYSINQKDINESMLGIIKYIGEESVYFWGSPSQDINYGIAIVNSRTGFVVLGGNELIFHWLLSLESIVYQYTSMIVGLIVPFFSVVYKLSKTPFLQTVDIIQSILFQVPYVDIISFIIDVDVNNMVESVKNKTDEFAFIGQGIGATISKRIISAKYKNDSALNINNRMPGLLYDGFSPENSYYCSTKGYSPSKFAYNIVSSLVIGAEEPTWAFNHKITGNSMFPSTTDAFCMTAAMCAPDNRYVSLCEQLGVSREKYAQWLQNPIVTK
jgi:hypothetical protein